MWGVVPGRRGYRRRSETGVEPGAPAAQRDGCRDSSDAGEPAVLTTMSAAMHRYVEVVKQYPGPEQVDMRVEIEVPGSWFGAGPMGALTDAERREKYTAQAVEYAEVREFPGACRGSRKTKEQAIRFICAADAADEPNSEGYWMKLSQWNRFRNDTFKDRREDELAFIPGQAPAAEGGVAMNLKAPQAPSIKTVFTLTDQGVHTQKDGTQVPCCWWTCVQKGCKLRGSPIKEIRKGTGLLFRHLRKCNHVLWLELQLSSKHSKAQLDEEGQLVQVSLDPVTVVPRSYTSSDSSDLACLLCHSSGHSRKVCRRTCVLWSTASSLGRFSTSRARRHSRCGFVH